MNISVDLISDLNLTKDQEFNWEGKASSLICAVAGNVSSEIEVFADTMKHLSKFYRGVFFIDGPKDHTTIFEYDYQIEMFQEVCESINNVVYLHDNVVVLEETAFIGINGWFHNGYRCQEIEELTLIEYYKTQDIAYLSTTIKRFQEDSGIDNIVVISSSIPNMNFFYNLEEEEKEPEPSLALVTDINHKVSNWLFSGSSIVTDQTYDDRRYCNNPKFENQPYWPKIILM